ncbi:M23 family metallopeptidase [Arthrobacter sp. NPDC092385]|uniref:M23 family metallopeptidase n=1 Tax=Arthrobacter sp. NPDC092385 TaxID=3363943 RepID=UPI0038018C98
MTQTVLSGRRRASDERAHHQSALRRSAHAPLPSRRSLRVQSHPADPAAPAVPATAATASPAAPGAPAVHGSAVRLPAPVAALPVAVLTAPVLPASPFVVPAPGVPAPAAHGLDAAPDRTRRELRERERAGRDAAATAALTPEATAPTPAAPVPDLPTRRSARASDLDTRPQTRSARRAARHSSTLLRAAAGPTPLARLRDNAATAGIVLASAGLLMGAVAPSAATTPAGADGVALASGIAPAVTAPAEATVIFALESAGPAAEGIAPSIADARALSASLTPAAKERKAFGAPVDNPVVASTFGYRVNPLGGYGSELHTGQDYASACGTPIRAADAGTVVDSGWHAYGGGQRIVIDHGDGLKTTYNHMSALGVVVGATVNRGDVIGAVGSTGNSTGCHLHFEVLVDDEKVDPQPWL